MGGLSSSAGVNIGDTIGGGTQGSVLFLGVAGALAERNNKLFWDDTNFRLGIGSITPGASLSSAGTIQSSNVDAAVSGAGVEINYDTVNLRGRIFAQDHTANTARRLEIGGPTTGSGIGGHAVYIGGNAPSIGFGPRIYLDGQNDLHGQGGIFFDSFNNSTFSFDGSNGITWKSPSVMLGWTNTNIGVAQLWQIRENATSTGIKLSNGFSGNVALSINAVAATGVITSIQIGTKFYAPQDTGALQTSCGLYAGLGVPNNANGANGDFYLRSDGGVGTNLYKKAGGVWGGIL